MKTPQSVVNKMDHFDGKDITKVLHKYEKEMELNRMPKAKMIDSFWLAMVLEIWGHVTIIQIVDGRNWKEFKLSWKDKYFMEDLERVHQANILRVGYKTQGWDLCHRATKGVWKALHLAITNWAYNLGQELFLQVVGKDLQEKLEILLKDKDTRQGLIIEWNEVEDVVSLLAQWQCQSDKMVVTIVTYVPTISKSPPKPAYVAPKGNGKIMEELIKVI